MKEALVRCESVSKSFCRDFRRSLWYGLQDNFSDLYRSASILTRNSKAQSAAPTTQKTLRQGEFWANRDINFELGRGECLGLIGRNGAGKTTLLKLLSGLILPDVGRIEMRGKVGAMIALGAGFNPLLTGRENILINGLILGLSRKQIADRTEEIIEFSELKNSIDTPVRNYSSGMLVRLGFAIATAAEPDILILDEVLAVGDAAFRHKCYHRIRKIMAKAAVILVSHSMDHILQTCDSVLLLKNGAATHYADTTEGVSAYNKENVNENSKTNVQAFTAIYPPVVNVRPTLLESSIPFGGRLTFQIILELAETIDDAIISLTAQNSSSQTVMAWHSGRLESPTALQSGCSQITVSLSPIHLHEGTYSWNLNIARKGKIEHIAWCQTAGNFSIESTKRQVGNIPYLPPAESFTVTKLP